MALRWGIASAGKICHDFTTALGTLPASDHRVVAVAARRQSSADEFARRHSIERSYEGYARLAADPDVDVVYIGTLNPQHYAVARQMLEAGKHVLVEKPLCMNAAQVEQLLALARERKLFLMEALWSRFFPAYQWLGEQIASGSLGEVREVDVAFGFPIADVDRLAKKELGGGTVLDLGVYVVQLSQWAFGGQRPTEISAQGELNADGCDVAMQAVLRYANGGIARIATSAREQLANVATIRGTKATIRVPHFWSPTTVETGDGSVKEWPLPQAKHAFNFENSAGLRYEAEHARQRIAAGHTEGEWVTHADSAEIARIEDEIRRQIGVQYEADDVKSWQ